VSAPVAALLTAGPLVILFVALLVSGHSPELHSLVRFTPKGLIAMAPSDCVRIEIRAGREGLTLRRKEGGWALDGGPDAISPELGSHLDAGLRFMHVSEPVRQLGADELTDTSFSAFGLDPPTSVVLLTAADGTIATINFGTLNPAATSQYVRLAGAATVYLMPRYVGTEWQVAGDMARRLHAQAKTTVAHSGTSLLLPVSIAQVWAVEILFAGKLSRFERDGAGNWFLHVGQHSHAGNTNAHVADPVQARAIGDVLQAFDQSTIEARIAHGANEAALQGFGLALPPLIVLLYARDSSAELARLEFGRAADSFDRYARLAPDGDVVTVAEFEVRRLTELLKTLGVRS
jgi:Domain of unknown function (DUF4340)